MAGLRAGSEISWVTAGIKIGTPYLWQWKMKIEFENGRYKVQLEWCCEFREVSNGGFIVVRGINVRHIAPYTDMEFNVQGYTLAKIMLMA